VQDIVLQRDAPLLQFLVVGRQRQVDGQPLPLKLQPLAGGLLTLGQRQRDVTEKGGLARAGVAQHDQPFLLAQHVLDAQTLRPFRPLAQAPLVHHLHARQLLRFARPLSTPAAGRGHVQRDVHLGQVQYHRVPGLHDATEIETAVGVGQKGQVLLAQAVEVNAGGDLCVRGLQVGQFQQTDRQSSTNVFGHCLLRGPGEPNG